MEHNVVVRMAKVLYGMVLAVFVFNLLVLPLVPGYTMMAYEGMGMGHPSISSLMGTMRSLLGAGEMCIRDRARIKPRLDQSKYFRNWAMK